MFPYSHMPGSYIVPWYHPPFPLFFGQNQFQGSCSRNQVTSISCTGHGILSTPTHIQDMCTANHRISKNSCQRPIITSHIQMSKILVKGVVISHRLTLEFIFTCQNANENVQNEPLSRGIKEANPLMYVFFFWSALFSFYFIFFLGVHNFDTIIHSHSNIQIHYVPSIQFVCVCVCVQLLAFLSKCFSARVNKDKVSHPC